MTYQCEECRTSFPKLNQLLQHRRTENHWKKFSCDICGKVFHRKNNLDRYSAKHKDQDNHHCSECGQSFSRSDNLLRHLRESHLVGRGQKRAVTSEDDLHAVKRLKNSDDPRQFYKINMIKEQRMEKFKTTATSYKVSFKDIDVTEDVLSTLKKLFSALFEDLTRESKPKDLVRLTVQTPSLDYHIVIPFLPIPQLTTDRFMSEIERVLQSNEDFAIDETLLFEVTVVDMPDGGTRKRCKFVNSDKFLYDKRCVIRIQNDDDLCCARAIATAKARINGHEKWDSIRKGRKIQEEMARQLHDQAGVALGKCGMEKIKMFQDILSDY